MKARLAAVFVIGSLFSEDSMQSGWYARHSPRDAMAQSITWLVDIHKNNYPCRLLQQECWLGHRPVEGAGDPDVPAALLAGEVSPAHHGAFFLDELPD
jgi:hypothetical protein